MLKNFLKTLVIILVAFLAACIFQTGLGEAYLWVNICWIGLKTIYLILCITIGGVALGQKDVADAANLVVVVLTVFGILINLGLAWAISRIFKLNLGTVYMVLNIIWRLIPSGSDE